MQTPFMFFFFWHLFHWLQLYICLKIFSFHISSGYSTPKWKGHHFNEGIPSIIYEVLYFFWENIPSLANWSAIELFSGELELHFFSSQRLCSNKTPPLQHQHSQFGFCDFWDFSIEDDPIQTLGRKRFSSIQKSKNVARAAWHEKNILHSQHIQLFHTLPLW